MIQINRYSKFIFVICCLIGTSVFSAERKSSSSKIPAEIKKQLEIYHPKSKILASTKCAIGIDKTESYGVLLDANKPRAFIFFKAKKGWNDIEVADTADNSKGGGTLFGDFFMSGKFEGPYEIRCTSPQNDKDVSLSANGEYIGTFAQKMSADIKHLCFQASDVYNSWKCLTMNPEKGGPDTSFVQLNSD